MWCKRKIKTNYEVKWVFKVEMRKGKKKARSALLYKWNSGSSHIVKWPADSLRHIPLMMCPIGQLINSNKK